MENVFCWGLIVVFVVVVFWRLAVMRRSKIGGEVTTGQLLDGSKWRGRWTVAEVGIANLVLHHRQEDRKWISYVMERSNKLPFAQVEGTRFMVTPANDGRDPRKNVIIAL